jgi:hypothetical protein
VRRLWFVMPVHGRLNLTRICLEQLQRTCEALAGYSIRASAVVIGDDENLTTAQRLGFGTIERDNTFLARKYNDGLQLACDPRLNADPVDYAVPIGSDDWIDYRILRHLPANDAVLAFRHVSFVSEDGKELSETRLAYEGGVGIRVYPRQLLEPSGYRPADEDRKRACDTSILYNTRRNYKREHGRDIRVTYGDLHPRQIVDWKSPASEQMNTFQQVGASHRSTSAGDPFTALEGLYPSDALVEMRNHYE